MAMVEVTQVTRPVAEKVQSESSGLSGLTELTAPLNELLGIAKEFTNTYHRLALESSTQFLPTPITTLPDGRENGRFLAMDLGGSNLRVGVVELFGDGGVSSAEDSASSGSGSGSESISPSSSTNSLPLVTQEAHSGLVKSEVLTAARFRIAPSATWRIPEELKSGQAEALFDWVGKCIGSVVRTYLSQCEQEVEGVVEQIMRRGLPMGVTFSFPMVQSSHTSALLMPMGKGFTFSTTNDLATLLTDAYAKERSLSEGEAGGGVKLPKVEVVAITNDSISTLLAGGYIHKGNATVGIIVGTGTNATCLCPVGKLGGLKKPAQKMDATHVLLNTEWSINGTLPPLEKYVTKWDRILDTENEKPGFQPLEEMVAGRYLGELVRLVSLDILGRERGGIRLPSKFYKPYAVETKLCADVEGAVRPEKVIEILKTYFHDNSNTGSSLEWDTTSATTFTKICKTVSDRAAALVVAATVGILDVNDDLGLYTPGNISASEEGHDVVISFTGTVIEKYPLFRERCQMFMDEVVEQLYDEHVRLGREVAQKRRRKVLLVEAKDGGIIGAAVLAGMVRAGRT